MKRFRLWASCLFVLTLVFAFGCGDDDVTGPPPGPEFSGRVSIDTVTASVGAKVRLEVNLSNTVKIAGVEIPLKISGSRFCLDSVSFVAGRFADFWINTDIINSTDQTVILLSIDTVGIEPGEGLYASLFFDLDSASAGEEIALDSCTIMVNPPYAHILSYATLAPVTVIRPEFVPGRITVVE